ncbi:hypothetical protein LCGC14_0342710 [marine sediment metagenome]|uniref:Uncharacterized protein n=1 Tax=marine sediment metagenome TaxID=412755 RepID=A0A0F9WL43_9ZZZZ
MKKKYKIQIGFWLYLILAFSVVIVGIPAIIGIFF